MRLRSSSTRVAVGSVLAVLGLYLATASAAAAAPSKWETFPITCGEVTFVVTASPGFWSSGKIVDAVPGAHVVSYAYSIVVTDLDANEVLYQDEYTKPGDRGQSSQECFDYTLSTDPDTGHQVSVDFRMVVFMPRPA